MGVAGQLEVHALGGGFQNIVRFMREQYYWLPFGNLLKGGIKIRPPFQHVVHASQP
jgi:hypothetical protein